MRSSFLELLVIMIFASCPRASRINTAGIVEYHGRSMTTLRKFIDNCNIDADVLYDEPMSAHTTFRIGGPADALVRPRSVGALAALVRAARDEAVPVAVIGGGANLLVGDKGVRGIVASTELLRAT